MQKNKKHIKPQDVAWAAFLLTVIVALFTVIQQVDVSSDTYPQVEQESYFAYIDKFQCNVPYYTGNPVYVVNGNVPSFNEDDISFDPIEQYSSLDTLGRCGTAFANVCMELMPTEDRKSISSVKPSGWVQQKYDFIEGKYLYNRCHLIAYRLAGENANSLNLITGTKYLNIQGMCFYENAVDKYIEEHTTRHVLYQVTPIYNGNELVARGVLIEIQSCEDYLNEDTMLRYCVFCYNVQPGVEIDYETGNSRQIN